MFAMSLILQKIEIYDIFGISKEEGEKIWNKNQSKKKHQVKVAYLTGILGAIVGGAIATIPWVLVYIYGGMMFSILAALIAADELYGYKIAKGKITKKYQLY